MLRTMVCLRTQMSAAGSVVGMLCWMKAAAASTLLAVIHHYSIPAPSNPQVHLISSKKRADLSKRSSFGPLICGWLIDARASGTHQSALENDFKAFYSPRPWLKLLVPLPESAEKEYYWPHPMRIYLRITHPSIFPHPLAQQPFDRKLHSYSPPQTPPPPLCAIPAPKPRSACGPNHYLYGLSRTPWSRLTTSDPPSHTLSPLPPIPHRLTALRRLRCDSTPVSPPRLPDSYTSRASSSLQPVAVQMGGTWLGDWGCRQGRGNVVDDGQDAAGHVTAHSWPKDAFLDRAGGWVAQLARRYLELAGAVSAPRFFCWMRGAWFAMFFFFFFFFFFFLGRIGWDEDFFSILAFYLCVCRGWVENVLLSLPLFETRTSGRAFNQPGSKSHPRGRFDMLLSHHREAEWKCSQSGSVVLVGRGAREYFSSLRNGSSRAKAVRWVFSFFFTQCDRDLQMSQLAGMFSRCWYPLLVRSLRFRSGLWRLG